MIKPLKVRPRLPENFERDTWARLQAAVQAVHAKQAVGHSLEELYRAVEDMCLQNLAGVVYERLHTECEHHIEARLSMLVGTTPDTQAFLSLVHATWADHCEQMLTLRSIFLYLDRTYIMQVPSFVLPSEMNVLHSSHSCLLTWSYMTATVHSAWPTNPRGRCRQNAHYGKWDCKSSAHI